MESRALEILENLCSKYHFDINRIKLSFFQGSTMNGSCGFLKTWVDNKAVKNYDIINIKLNNSIKDDKKLLGTIVHEFAHALQYYFLGEEKTKELTRTKCDKVRFTAYQKNLCEIQAEAFTMFELGYTNNSFVGGKDMECYKKHIQDFFNQFELYR